MILSVVDKLCLQTSDPLSAASLQTCQIMPIGFARQPTLQEIFVAPDDAAAIGLTLAQLEQGKHASQAGPLLWIQEKKAIREAGRTFLHGLHHFSNIAMPSGIVHVAAKDGREALWAMAEGLKCPTLGAVIGEVHGDPRALDFTATRRLAVAAERYGVPAFLMRIQGSADLSGARRRWRVKSRPSLPHPHNSKAPGVPVWSLDLFRARDTQPRLWEVAYDGAAYSVDLVSAIGDRALDEGQRKAG